MLLLFNWLICISRETIISAIGSMRLLSARIFISLLMETGLTRCPRNESPRCKYLYQRREKRIKSNRVGSLLDTQEVKCIIYIQEPVAVDGQAVILHKGKLYRTRTHPYSMNINSRTGADCISSLPTGQNFINYASFLQPCNN